VIFRTQLTSLEEAQKMIGTAATARARRAALTVGFGIALGASLAPAAAQSALGPVNLAPGKYVHQSSQYGGASPDLAIDGNTDGNFWNGSVTHTQSEAHAWWEIDLGESRQIGRVEIWNRTDCCGDRLSSLMVIAADTGIIDSDITDPDDQMYPGIMRTMAPNPGQAHVVVPINRSARFIRIALGSENPLSLAEVQVIEAENAARGRAATQSSTQPGGDPNNAVDGNTNGAFGARSVSATQVQANANWKVDLGLQHDIREIHVWSSHTDCCATGTPPPRINVYVSTTPIGVPQSAQRIATVDQGWPAVVAVDKPGRYVAIELAGTDSLSLAEVQVWPFARGAVGGHARSVVTRDVLNGNDSDLGPIDFSRVRQFQSYQSDQPFWDLDLGSHRYIETIKVWTLGAPTMATFHLFTSDGNPFADANGTPISYQAALATPGASHWIGRGTDTVTAVSVMKQARFVRIQLSGFDTNMAMAEVELVTTEGFAIGTLADESGLRVNGSLVGGAANNTLTQVADADRTMFVDGHFPRAGTRINAYAFVPGANGVGGTYNLFASTTTGSTPELTVYSGAPQYAFSFPTFVFPGDWLTGSVGIMMFSADDNDGFTATPIRSINDDASEHVYWPDIRLVSPSPTPDGTAIVGGGGGTKPPSNQPYLDLPMKDATVSGYPNNTLIPTTLSAFRTKYGITGGTSIHAGYYNAGDLGIGRDMYCRSPSPYTVCQVDNWAKLDSNHQPIFGDPVGASGGSAVLAATVVMVKQNSGVAWFGAYDAKGNRLNNIALDTTGQRTAIPNNCMTCHGGAGSFTNAKGVTSVANSWFLPFDLQAFLDRGSFKLSAQEEAFRQLNAFVRAQSQIPDAARELIDGWYHRAVNTPGQKFDGSFVPTGWTRTPADTRVYNDVIKPYCRTCHVVQGFFSALDFHSAYDADNLRALVLANVCSLHRMPHAQQTLRRFWTSGARAQLLGHYGHNEVVPAACGR
jgi:hypothetical protein